MALFSLQNRVEEAVLAQGLALLRRVGWQVIVVADRGLLSLDNLDELQRLRVGENPLEFILAVPGRRYAEFADLLQDFQAKQCVPAREEVTGEAPWQGFRLVVAHHPVVAAERTAAMARV